MGQGPYNLMVLYTGFVNTDVKGRVGHKLSSMTGVLLFLEVSCCGMGKGRGERVTGGGGGGYRGIKCLLFIKHLS